MAGRGPIPKDPRDRARQNASPVPYQIIDAAPSPQPPLPATMPDGSEWPERTRQWWAMWGSNPRAADFHSTDWAMLLDTAVLHALLWFSMVGLTVVFVINRICRLRVHFDPHHFRGRSVVLPASGTPKVAAPPRVAGAPHTVAPSSRRTPGRWRSPGRLRVTSTHGNVGRPVVLINQRLQGNNRRAGKSVLSVHAGDRQESVKQ
jgi:hypothetical protein